jgi:hypothetical protein
LERLLAYAVMVRGLSWSVDTDTRNVISNEQSVYFCKYYTAWANAINRLGLSFWQVATLPGDGGGGATAYDNDDDTGEHNPLAARQEIWETMTVLAI